MVDRLVHNAVDATADNAMQGLYLTPDMFVSAAYITPRFLESTVDKMHRRQPLTSDFEPFADRVSETYRLWTTRVEIYNRMFDPALGKDPLDDVRIGDLMMMAADLSTTYAHIQRGLLSITDLATAIILRTQNAVDSAFYARVIPPALEDMRILSIEHVTVETFYRILTVEPWISWLERLRAQNGRSRNLLQQPDIAEALADGTAYLKQVVADTKMNRQQVFRITQTARKSIRKSAKMFDRVVGSGTLRQFLTSDTVRPLEVEGRIFNYQMTLRKNSLIKATIYRNTGMSTVATTVHRKSGERLCSVCHYFEDTPVLDAVIATALNVQVEETELDLLKAACVIDAPRAFYNDAVLPTLKQLFDPATAPTLVQNIFNHADTLPDDRQTDLRDEMRKHALPLAYAAFKRVNRMGKQYFPVMRMCSAYSMWEYMNGETEATLHLNLAQRTIDHGEFY